MSIVIQELVVRVEITSQPRSQVSGGGETTKLLKKQILAECKKLIQKQNEIRGLNR